MAFHTTLSDLEGTSNSLIMNERDRQDPMDTCACPSTVELSKAVSVSLGLDLGSSPHNTTNQCATSAFPDCVPSLGRSTLGAPGFGAAGSVTSDGSRLLQNDKTPRDEELGEVCVDIHRLSCMDLLRSSEMESARTVTHGPATARYVCKESNLYMSSMDELPASSRGDEIVPLKAHSTYSANLSRYRNAAGVWCVNERTYGGQSEPDSCGPGGANSLCKYCICGKASVGSRQHCHCVWYNNGDNGGKGLMRAAMAQGFGQAESYQSALPQGQASYSAVKTEPTGWLDCTDSTFR